MGQQGFHQRCTHRNNATKLAVILAWVAVFIPGHLYGWLLERSYSALLLVIAIASFALSAGKVPHNCIGRRGNVLLLGLLVVTALYVFSAVLIMLLDDYEMTLRDILDLPRYIVLGAIFVIVGNADPNHLRSALDKLIIFSLSFALFVLLMYLLDVPLLSDIAFWLYQDTKTAIAFPRWIRLSVPFENPNFLAFYAILCLAYALFFTNGKNRAILATLSFVVLFATGSRSGWAAAVVLNLGLIARVSLGMFYTRSTLLRKDFQFLISLLLITLCLLWFLYPYLLESVRVQLIIRALDEGGIFVEPNVAGRLDMFSEAFRVFSQSPIFGSGPYKAGGLDVIDNQYLINLARQGLLGFILTMSIMLYIFSGAIKFAQTWEEKFGVVFMWLAVSILLMTGAFLSNFRLFFLFAFFVVALNGKAVDSIKTFVYRSPRKLLPTE